MYDALDIARYIINYCNDHNIVISNLRLQKLLYFVQAAFLMHNPNSPCFDNNIVAWSYGPVVPDVYYQFKIFGSGNIPKSSVANFNNNIININDRAIIDELMNDTSDYSTSQLVRITHKQRPWRETYVPKSSNIITLESLRSYFCNGN